MKRLTIGLAVAGLALILSGAASGVGPWPGVVRSISSPIGDVRYTIARSGESTTIHAIRDGSVVRTATFDGTWGIPAVTSTGLAGGLSPDGEMLVLGQPPTYAGLRSESQFLIVATATLTLEKTLTRRGRISSPTACAPTTCGRIGCCPA
jgi:hypothetical protein